MAYMNFKGFSDYLIVTVQMRSLNDQFQVKLYPIVYMIVLKEMAASWNQNKILM